MPSTRVIKPRPVETATKKTLEKSKEVKVKATDGARQSRASSCLRNAPPRGACDGAPRGPRSSSRAPRSPSRAPRGPGPACGRRARSTAPTPTETRTNPPRRRAASSVRPADGRCVDAGPRAPRGGGAEVKYMIQSNKAFTVIPPNPKKRREIQRKAEAELAALEELRLSRAMAYVSIHPSSVGGCMSLEEVRLKQQQDMMQARRKHKQVKKVMEETPVLSS
ncbi:uncharacterized protein zgc:194621 isoform X2 [Cololabis saira]|uniref:uncharacterized protein zgc:194621 isoform X2 n=1 Tax=Cololabis saira TaxID=129043 RepID=UPI002AD30DBB|nr:uncharacterized protein zgc:194621 isoform X2 [Cololabis saira]